MRTIQITPELARALGKLRAAAQADVETLSSPNRGRPPTSGRVRLQDIEAVEKELGVTLPDPALAYVAAGVSVWGDGPLNVLAIRERTLAVRDLAEAYGPPDEDEESAEVRYAVLDDDSNGNYVAVVERTPRDSDALTFLDHELGYACEPPSLSLEEAIARVLEDVVVTGEPFYPELYDEPYPEPPTVWASHAKFGRGRVTAEAGDTVTVVFEGVGEKRLKRSFLRFD